MSGDAVRGDVAGARSSASGDGGAAGGGTPGPGAVLRVEGLTVAIGGTTLVAGVDLRVAAGECVALVGASGSGKTVTARALLGLSAVGAAVHADRLDVDGTHAVGFSDREWRRLRGRTVGYVGQEALGALDPLRPVGREVGDALRLHTHLSAVERRDAVRTALAAVGLDPALATDGRTSGALSGGMRQRALIAAATVASPALVIADEPTTALDAEIAVTVMATLRDAQRRGAGLLVITHDLGLVAGWADRVVVMDGGRVVEEGPVERVFAAPTHAATRALVRAARAGAGGAPSDAGPGSSGAGPGATGASGAAPGATDAGSGASAGSAWASDTGARMDTADGRAAGRRTGVLSARGLGRWYGDLHAVADVSLDVEPGRVLGVVGASGSGKTTLTRMLLGLETPDTGTVQLDGEPWAPLRERDRRARRGRIAAVVQDPGATFDPRWDVERVLADALTGGDARRASGALSGAVDAALRSVDLDPALRSRSPLTLSGGQRQRLAIARALATGPELLVLDEPVTALDATVQDAVLGLLERLRDDTGVAMVMVSHDLRAVRRLADDVVVVDAGEIIERGPAAAVLSNPAHPVTARLVAAAERLATPVRSA